MNADVTHVRNVPFSRVPHDAGAPPRQSVAVARFRLRFSEPWELSSIVATLELEIDDPKQCVDAERPIIARIVSADWDTSLAGKRAQLRPRLSVDEKPLTHFPTVNVAYEHDGGWRGIGFGKLSLIQDLRPQGWERLLPP